MNTAFKCKDCKHEFEEPDEATGTYSEYPGAASQTYCVDTCPACGSTRIKGFTYNDKKDE